MSRMLLGHEAVVDAGEHRARVVDREVRSEQHAVGTDRLHRVCHRELRARRLERPLGPKAAGRMRSGKRERLDSAFREGDSRHRLWTRARLRGRPGFQVGGGARGLLQAAPDGRYDPGHGRRGHPWRHWLPVSVQDPGGSIRSDAGTGLSGRLSTRSGEGLLRRPHWRSLRRLAGSVDVDPLRIPLDRHQQTGLGGGQLPGPGHAFPDREGIRRSPRQTGFSRPAPRFAVPRISPPRAAGLDAPPSPRGAARPPIQSPEGRPSSSHPARATGGRVRPVESVWIVEIGVVRDRPIVDSPGTPA